MMLTHDDWNIARWFSEAGVAAYLILLLALGAGAFGLVASAVAGLGPKNVGPIVATLALVGAAFVLVAGLVGEAHGMNQVREAIAHVNPCDRDTILFFGSHEARQCIKIALLLATAPSAAAAIAAVIATVRNGELSPLLVGGAALLVVAIAVDGVALKRPYEGRELRGAPRDVLCQVLQPTSPSHGCAGYLVDVSDEDAAAIRALPEYDAKKIDECITAALADPKLGEIRNTAEIESLRSSRLLDDAQRKRVADALARWKADAEAANTHLGGLMGDAISDEPNGGLGLTGVGIGTQPGARTLNPEADFRKHGKGVKAEVNNGPVDAKGGGLPPEIIQRIVRLHMGEQRYCYETALRRDPSIAGKVYITLVIGKSGDVTSATVGDDSTLKDPTMRACLTGRLMRMKFPPSEAGITQVRYPFVFQPAN